MLQSINFNIIFIYKNDARPDNHSLKLGKIGGYTFLGNFLCFPNMATIRMKMQKKEVASRILRN